MSNELAFYLTCDRLWMIRLESVKNSAHLRLVHVQVYSVSLL